MHSTLLTEPRLADHVLGVADLRALWTLDDRSGTFRDLVGGGGSGTAAGGVTYGGASNLPLAPGGAVVTDGGVGTRITGTGTNLPLGSDATAWTIFAWCFYPATPAASSAHFGFGTPAGTGTIKGRWLIRFNSHIYFWGDSYDLDSTTDYDVGRVQMIAASNSGGVITTYKNGAQVASGNPAGSLATPDSGLWGISHDQAAFSVEVAGRFSHFGIVARTMTLNELRHLHVVAMGA